MTLSAYQRLAQDSINYQMRTHEAEAALAEAQAEVERLTAELAAKQKPAKPT